MRADFREWLPPALWRLIGSFLGQRIRFSGRYEDWDAALAATGGGYAAPDILERAKKTPMAMRTNRAKVAAPEAECSADIPMHIVAALLRAASMGGGRLSVVDYGGAMGGTYFRCARMLDHLVGTRWCVVEQPGFVAYGRRHFETDALTFHESLEECQSVSPPNVILFSAVLQYLPDPWSILEAAAITGALVIVIDRTPIVSLPDSKLTVQRIPARLGKASYPAWLFNRAALLRGLMEKFRLLCEFPAIDGEMMYGFRRVAFKGFLLEKNVNHPDSREW